MAHSALLAAQVALQQRRAAWRQHRMAHGLPVHTDDAGRALATADPAPASLQDIPWQTLPDHLGWGSHALTAHLRPRQPAATAPAAAASSIIEERLPDSSQAATNTEPSPKTSLAISPDIALAILKAKQAAAGRLWYVLRSLDTAGRGWFNLADVRQIATHRQNAFHFCGRRQLRNLLRAGESLFWQQRGERLWLRRPARVAAALGLDKIVHRPVALHPQQLLGPLKQVKSQLYATLHSARTPNSADRNRAPQSAPIARQILENLTGLTRQTQRQYEQQARVNARRQFAIGPHPTPELSQELAWQRGNSLFTYRDRRGQFGQADQSYLAWQLPNRYQGPHERLSRLRRRRLQRELTDLLTKGTTGNGQAVREMEPVVEPGKRYGTDVRGAISCQRSAISSRCPANGVKQLAYWPAEKSGYWFVLLGGK
ncbi:MAG: hypothetical protein KDE34_12135 [Anaerolineales bacterium]|nr:hypothetical protein [Anaerolineales bacterium]